MLQKIRELTHGWFAWVLILGLAFVFTLWGVSGYLMSDGGDKVIAKVANKDVTQKQVQTLYEHMLQQAQLSQVMAGIQNPRVNIQQLQTKALQQAVMETLLTTMARREGFAMSREQVDTLLRSMPQFHVNGAFSLETYERLIHQLNFTPEQFRNTVQNEMLIAQVQSTISDSAFVWAEELSDTVALINQTRDFRYVVLDANALAKSINLTQTDLEAYYNSNKSEFMTTETVEVSYILLDKDLIEKSIRTASTPTDQELQQRYQESLTHYTTPERRSASHILLTLPPDAKPDEVAKVKQEADDLYKRIKAGESFEKLAKQYSKDPGSATQGGALGFFGPGEMVPEFESAVFHGQKGELIPPVRTEFGYHIIRIDDIKKPEVPTFDKVKQTLTEQWYEDKIVEQYESEQNKLDSLAFENPESLKDVATAFNLPLQNLVIDKTLTGNTGLAANAMILQAVFGDEPLPIKQNSDILTISPTQSVLINITARHMPALKPFKEIELEVRAKAGLRKGMMMARDMAAQIKEKYATGTSLDAIATKENFKWSLGEKVDRQNTDIPKEVLQLAFATPLGSQPALSSSEIQPNKMVVVVVNKITPGVMDQHLKDTALKGFEDGLLNFIGHRDYLMYVDHAKNVLKIEMKQ